MDAARLREDRPQALSAEGLEALLSIGMALRIEIEGRAPVILDVPEGTWTEHDGEDGLWATWDLGVVEVPGSP